MPELPEVDVIKQSLLKTIVNKKINKVIIHNPNLRFRVNKNIKKMLVNKKIKNVSRIAKYLIIHTNTNIFLIIHFGMSGTLHMIKNNKKLRKTNLSFYSQPTLSKKHNHLEIFFSNFKLVYNDPRRFGFVKTISNLKNLKKYFKRVGPEPYDKNFNKNYLIKNFKKRQKNIKNTLLDQKIVAGLGNIYVNEILFYSKIYPLKKASDINEDFIKKIIKYSKQVLNVAIKNGGSSIRDFQNTGGHRGTFQNEFKVYGKNGLSCSRKYCKGKIQKVFVSSRSTFYCNICQK